MTVQPTVLVVMTTLPLASVGVTVLEYSSSIRDAGNPNTSAGSMTKDLPTVAVMFIVLSVIQMVSISQNTSFSNTLLPGHTSEGTHH